MQLMCCSVLQCVAVCCSVLQCVAVCCSVSLCVAVYRSVWQRVAACGSVLQYGHNNLSQDRLQKIDSHVQTSHVARSNKSCRTFERVMSHVRTSYVTYSNESSSKHVHRCLNISTWIGAAIWILNKPNALFLVLVRLTY